MQPKKNFRKNGKESTGGCFPAAAPHNLPPLPALRLPPGDQRDKQPDSLRARRLSAAGHHSLRHRHPQDN